MALDKNKIVAEASKYAQKGQYDKAVKAYERILAQDPKDVRVRLKIGEIQQKKGDLPAAAETFHECAQAYGEQGFALKAVAVYKQIARLTPEDGRVPEKLAMLYQQLGLVSDAMGQMQALAQAHERAGDEPKVLEVLRRMAELDADNVATAVKLGELYVRSGQPGPGLEQFRRAAAALKKTARVDEYLKVAERVASLAPQDLTLTRELANIYLARGDTKRALAKLQLCFKADPKEAETLTLLAQAFRDLGQHSKTVSVYRELAHVYLERGRGEEARSIFRKVLELSPDDAEAQEGAGQHRQGAPAAPPVVTPSWGSAAPAAPAAPLREPRGIPFPSQGEGQGGVATVAPRPPSLASPREPRGIPSPLQGEGQGGAATAPLRPPSPSPSRATGGEVAPGGSPAAPSPPSPTAGAIPRLLTEIDVYLKYGLTSRALEHVNKILAEDPSHPGAHERCREIHARAGDPASAAREGALAVRGYLSAGRAAEAAAALERLSVIAPDHPELAELSAASAPAPDALEPLPGEAIAFDDGEALVVGEEDIEPVDEDALALSMAADEGKEIVLEEEPASVSALPSPSQEGAADQPLTPAAHQPSTPPPRAPDLPALDEESLGEADFFIQQGLLDDARELLEQLAGTYPGHPALAERFAILAAVEAGEAAEPAGAAEPVEPAAQVEPAVAAPPEPPSELAPHAVAPLPIAEGGVNFDLGKELASEFAAQAASPADEFQYSVGDVFSQFKKGIEQTVRPEDGETHYDLGIAYKEMGLLDDAVQEFETALAAGGRKKELDCLTMIGLCRMAQGLPSQAVEVFRRALGSDGLGIESAKALHLELGLAFEAAGDPQAALSTFQKIVRIDPGYREVAAAVARLRSGPGLPAAQGGPPGAALSRAPEAPLPADPPAPASEPADGPGRPGPRKKIGYV